MNVEDFNKLGEDWFTIETIKPVESTDKLYCISVDSKEKQFQIGGLGIPTHNTDEAKTADELKGEAIMIIGSIARLGRASGVHLVIATQRPRCQTNSRRGKRQLSSPSGLWCA